MTEKQTPTSPLKRNLLLDSLRGGLIILVIIGHVLLGAIEDTFIRYVIYSFHMPLFIGLTGYLINKPFLASSSNRKIFLRYWWRMLIPFLLAFLFFKLIITYNAAAEDRLTFELILSYFHTPYYHLWFIPTLLIWVFLVSWILKFRMNIVVLWIIFAGLSLYWAISPESGISFFTTFVSKKVIYFFSFFLFGCLIRTYEPQVTTLVKKYFAFWLMLLVASSFFYLTGFDSPTTSLHGMAWLLLNHTLILVTLNWAATEHSFQKMPRLLLDVGRFSLPIYLWHVAPLFVLKQYDVHISSPLVYYLLSGVSISILIAVIRRQHSRNALSKILIYGD